jgi:hypothetical protein
MIARFLCVGTPRYAQNLTKKESIWPYLGHIGLHPDRLSRLSSLKSENATEVNADGIENGKHSGFKRPPDSQFPVGHPACEFPDRGLDIWSEFPAFRGNAFDLPMSFVPQIVFMTKVQDALVFLLDRRATGRQW